MNSITVNLWLWALTGRSGDFVDPELNTQVSYGSGDAAGVAAARTLLNLYDDRTDFHVLGALHAALYCARFAGLPEAVSTFLCEASRPAIRPVTITGATLAPSAAKRWPVIRNHPPTIPAPTTYTVAYDGLMALLSTDTGYVSRVPYRAAGSTVVIDALADIGTDAAFVTDSGTWTTGDSFSFFCEPGRYPYAEVGRLIKSDRDMVAFAISHTSVAALDGIDPFMTVGALALSIMRAQTANVLPIPAVPPQDALVRAWLLELNQLAITLGGLTLSGDPICYAP